MAEEVPTPPQRKYPRWKEYSLFEKAWILFQDYIPILIWIGFGLLMLKLGEP